MKKGKRPNPPSAQAKREAFVREYLIDLNSTQAAIRAGFSAKTAAQAGHRLFTKVEIRTAIDDAIAARAEKTGLTAELIIAELLHIARVDIGALYDDTGALKPIHDIPEAARRAIGGIDMDELWEGQGADREQVGITKKVKLLDKIRALELLGKHLKLFVDRMDVTSNGLSLAELVALGEQRANR